MSNHLPIIIKDYKTLSLTPVFYTDYNISSYPQILDNNQRPYLMLHIELDSRHYFIPLRSNHKASVSDILGKQKAGDVLITTEQQNEKRTIDFTKTVIISDQKYVGSNITLKDKDQKQFISDNKEYVAKKLMKYIHKYKRLFMSLEKITIYNNFSYLKMLYYFFTKSSLIYFHNELGLNDPMPILKNLEAELLKAKKILKPIIF